MNKSKFPKLQSVILMVLFIIYMIKDQDKMIMSLVIIIFIYICEAIIRNLYNQSIRGK